jgi:hypothetical protein
MFSHQLRPGRHLRMVSLGLSSTFLRVRSPRPSSSSPAVLLATVICYSFAFGSERARGKTSSHLDSWLLLEAKSSGFTGSHEGRYCSSYHAAQPPPGHHHWPNRRTGQPGRLRCVRVCCRARNARAGRVITDPRQGWRGKMEGAAHAVLGLSAPSSFLAWGSFLKVKS